MGNPISSYRWENRILLVFASDQSSGLYKKQMGMFEEETDEIIDRELLIFSIFNDGGRLGDSTMLTKDEVELLRSKYKIDDSEEKLLLIGKDGSVKLEGTLSVKPSKIFGLIDTMPMRQAEIKGKGG